MRQVFSLSVVVPGKLWTVNSERANHWTRRADSTAIWRRSAFIEARRLGRNAFTEPVAIHVQPYQRRGALADAGAHAMVAKAAIDGLVDAKVLQDDTPEFVSKIVFHAPERSNVESLHLCLFASSFSDLETLMDENIKLQYRLSARSSEFS